MIYDIIKYTVSAAAVTITFNDLVAYVSPISGISMQPLLNPKNKSDWVLLYRSASNIKRGDIVTLKSPKNPKEFIIKRVIGLPGDVIKTRSYEKRFVLIPPGHCWLEGDNTKNSADSNYYGAVSMGLFVSKAVYIIWPLNRISKIQTKIPQDRLLIPLHEINTTIVDNPELIDILKQDKLYMNNYFVDFLPE